MSLLRAFSMVLLMCKRFCNARLTRTSRLKRVLCSWFGYRRGQTPSPAATVVLVRSRSTQSGVGVRDMLGLVACFGFGDIEPSVLSAVG